MQVRPDNPKTGSLAFAFIFAVLGVAEVINFAVGSTASTTSAAYNAGSNAAKPFAIVLALALFYAAWNRYKTWARSRR